MDAGIRQTSRWTHWAFPLLAAALLVGLGWVLRGHIRLLIPSYVLGSYWLLAAAINRRTVVFNASGLHVTVAPIPVRAPLHLDRNAIRCIYVRYVLHAKDDIREGQDFYMVGVESQSGLSIPLDGPFPDLGAVRIAVQKTAFAANTGEHERLIPVKARNEAPPAPPVDRFHILSWAAAFLLATLLGGMWETSQ